uniref:Uncharacterized protein n=1 Tax=Moniliophthora roreri TaxID=221103 RepID=A0A0W0GFT6_MONRR
MSGPESPILLEAFSLVMRMASVDIVKADGRVKNAGDAMEVLGFRMTWAFPRDAVAPWSSSNSKDPSHCIDTQQPRATACLSNSHNTFDFNPPNSCLKQISSDHYQSHIASSTSSDSPAALSDIAIVITYSQSLLRCASSCVIHPDHIGSAAHTRRLG